MTHLVSNTFKARLHLVPKNDSHTSGSHGQIKTKYTRSVGTKGDQMSMGTKSTGDHLCLGAECPGDHLSKSTKCLGTICS